MKTVAQLTEWLSDIPSNCRTVIRGNYLCFLAPNGRVHNHIFVGSDSVEPETFLPPKQVPTTPAFDLVWGSAPINAEAFRRGVQENESDRRQKLGEQEKRRGLVRQLSRSNAIRTRRQP